MHFFSPTAKLVDFIFADRRTPGLVFLILIVAFSTVVGYFYFTFVRLGHYSQQSRPTYCSSQPLQFRGSDLYQDLAANCRHRNRGQVKRSAEHPHGTVLAAIPEKFTCGSDYRRAKP
jgi:hypothetical protein